MYIWASLRRYGLFLHSQTHTHVLTDTDTHMHVHTDTHTHVRTDTHTRTHRHTPASPVFCLQVKDRPFKLTSRLGREGGNTKPNVIHCSVTWEWLVSADLWMSARNMSIPVITTFCGGSHFVEVGIAVFLTMCKMTGEPTELAWLKWLVCH